MKNTNTRGRKELENIINFLAELQKNIEYSKYSLKNKKISDEQQFKNMTKIIRPVEKRIKQMSPEEIVKFVLSIQFLDEAIIQKDILLRLLMQDINYLKDANKERMDYKMNKEFKNEIDKETYQILNYNLLRELNGSTSGDNKDIEYFLKLSKFQGIWDSKTNNLISASKYIKNKYKEKYDFCYRILIKNLDVTSKYKLFYEMSKNERVLEVLNF